MNTNKILVLGLGNILLRDEGVGVHAVNTVRERCAFPPSVQVIDGGTLGLDLLHFFEDKDRVLIVDAVDFKKEPGHIGLIEDDDIPSTLFAKLSVHHIGLSDILYAAKLKGITPSKMCLIGVQPASLELGLSMTDVLQERLEAVIETILQKLKEWNVECASQSPQKLSR